MTTITRERLLKIQQWRETYGPGSNVVLPAEEAEELARIALAVMDAEPVGEVSEQPDGLVMDGTVHLGGSRTHRVVKGLSKMKRLPLGTKFYTAPPAPVDNTFIPKILDRALGVVGVALPESKEEFNFQIERWIQRLIDRVIRYADEFKEQPAPVVPEEMPKPDTSKMFVADAVAAISRAEGWNACRAAMLNQAPVITDNGVMPDYEGVAMTQRECYRAGYEAGKAESVRQRDDLPELIGMAVSVDVSTCDSDAGNRYFGTVTEVSELNGAKNGYILLVQDAEPNFKPAGNSPVIPDDWVMVPRVPTTEMANSMVGVDGCSTTALLGALKLAIAAAPQQEAE